MQSQEPQAIVAAFESREDAENAVRELKANGFDESCIDITTTEGVRFDASDDLAEDHDHMERTLVTVRDSGRLTQAAALMEGCGGYCDPRATGSWEAVRTDPGPGQTALRQPRTPRRAPPDLVPTHCGEMSRRIEPQGWRRLQTRGTPGRCRRTCRPSVRIRIRSGWCYRPAPEESNRECCRRPARQEHRATPRSVATEGATPSATSAIKLG